jgi:hypothetical protein
MLYFDLILPYLILCLLRYTPMFVHVLVCCSFVLSKCIECMLALFRQRAVRVLECVAEDLPEQQPSEGKCPLTYYVLRTL